MMKNYGRESGMSSRIMDLYRILSRRLVKKRKTNILTEICQNAQVGLHLNRYPKKFNFAMNRR